MRNYFNLLRPKNWIKNFLIFVPMFFSLNTSKGDYFKLVGGFICFCFIASCVYIINDLNDLEQDKKHPDKKNRPLAAGIVKPFSAKIFLIILFCISICLNTYLCKEIITSTNGIILGYLIINILYSKGLKNYPIIDIFILSSCFILRLFYGSELVGVPISSWLFLTTLSGTLFLGIGKRKKEFDKGKVRIVLESYTEDFLEKFSTICLSLTITFYSLWVMNQNNDVLFLSVPFVIFIFMQYTLTLEKEKSGDPTTIFLKNKPIIASSFLYVIFMIFVLYFY